MMARCAMLALPLLLVLGACSSMSEKSHSLFSDKLIGLDHFDTQSEEDKEKERWFDSFYGKRNCGVWDSACPQ